MLVKRIIPILLFRDGGLVKTVKFKNEQYIGDPLNSIRIFNSKFVDELILLDISRSRLKNGPNFKLAEMVAGECFMPLSFGGGISSLDHAKKILEIGIEKVVVQTALFKNMNIINEISQFSGDQSLCVSIIIKTDVSGNKKIFDSTNSKFLDRPILDFICEVQDRGAGEVLVTSFDREGTMSGYDMELFNELGSKFNIPIIAHGGGSSIKNIKEVLDSGADAAAAGSLFVYYTDLKGVLINYPDRDFFWE